MLFRSVAGLAGRGQQQLRVRGAVQPSTSLGAVPKFAPIDNQPSATRLLEAKKIKNTLLASVEFAHNTKDGGVCPLVWL